MYITSRYIFKTKVHFNRMAYIDIFRGLWPYQILSFAAMSGFGQYLQCSSTGNGMQILGI